MRPISATKYYRHRGVFMQQTVSPARGSLTTIYRPVKEHDKVGWLKQIGVSGKGSRAESLRQAIAWIDANYDQIKFPEPGEQYTFQGLESSIPEV